MRQTLGTAVVALGCMLGTGAHADTLFGIYAGVGTWQQSYGGNVTSGTTSVDIEDELGLPDESNNVLYVAIEHPLPLLPNIRAQHADLTVGGTATLTRSIDFNGSTFNVSDDVSTAIDLTQTDAVLYYEVLDNYVSLDLGLAVRMIDGEISVESTVESAVAEFEGALPMLYAKVRADLPFTGMWVSAELQGIGYDGNSLTDANAQIGWESSMGLGLEAGWRQYALKLDDLDDIDDGEIDISGPFAAVNFHF